MGCHNQMDPHAILIDRNQFQRMLCIKKSTFFDWKKHDPNFPVPIVFPGGRTIRWRMADAIEYISNFQQAKPAVSIEGGVQ